MRDPETGASRGFAFISYDSFEASDAAVAMMNGQFINNRAINVSYAMKKDGKGERHGTEAGQFYFKNKYMNLSCVFFFFLERLLAKKNVLAKPTTVAPISRYFLVVDYLYYYYYYSNLYSFSKFNILFSRKNNLSIRFD